MDEMPLLIIRYVKIIKHISIAYLNEGNSSNKDSILFSMLNVGVTKDNGI